MMDDLAQRAIACADEVMGFPHPSHCDHLHDASAVLRELAGEIERLRKLEAEWAALSQDDGKAEREIERLSSELDHFKNSGIIEVAVRNASVSEYMRHWEGRALSAEAELERLRAQLAARDRDAERWRKLPAFLEDYQIDYVNLLRDIDAAIDAAMATPQESP
jgi:chromosome segregation ATPase